MTTDELAVHEREVRAYATGSADVILRRHLTAVLAEYKRLKADNAKYRANFVRLGEVIAEQRDELLWQVPIVEAATELAEYWKTRYPTEYGHFPEQDRLTDALIAAVERNPE